MKKESTCPFCKDSTQSQAYLESENFAVIYNQAPILPGHSLVIPKDHIESLLDLNEFQLEELMSLSRKAALVVLRAFKADSFNWTVQEKPAAGQTVPHMHLHVIPRFDGDLPKPGDWYPKLSAAESTNHIDSDEREKLSRDEIDRISLHLKSIASDLGF